MRALFFASAVLALSMALPASATRQTTAFHHDLWDRVLQSFVTPAGLVQYAALKAHPEDLKAYIALLASDSPDSSPQRFPADADRLAYWIDAYNAEILNRVVEHYPVRSIKDLGGVFGSVFKKTQTVGGRPLSHDDIEHGIIRKRFHEPRVHFVLNCASRSCAPLGRHALTGGNLETSLQEAAVNFLNDPRNVRIDPDSGTVELSKYFDWFPEDFIGWLKNARGLQNPTVLDFVKLYLKPDKRALLERRDKWRIKFLDYDWSLNDAGRAAAK